MGLTLSFSSVFFLYLFLPLSAICYFVARTKYRSMVLILFSLLFYAWGEPVYVWLLLFATCMNYVLGRVIGGEEGQEADPQNGKIALIIAVILNVGLLVGAKYMGFLVESINGIFSASIPVPGVQYPLGVGFFSLRAISYMVDCYRGKIRVESKFSNFLLYMTLFPIMPAGPLVRYETIQSELTMQRASIVDLGDGLGRIVLGLAKKVIIADQLGAVADQFLGGSSLETQTMLGAWFGVILFGLQVYFDLSGYSDMAIGIGRIFGFHFEENFSHPFLCKSITDFWKRWHISLSSFFRDYVLSAFGDKRKVVGLLITGMLMGLWHGAGWSFVLCGLYFGVFLVIEMLVGEEQAEKIPMAVRQIYSKLVIFIGFGIFYFQDLGQVGTCLKTMFGMGGNGFADDTLTSSFGSHIALILLAVLCCFPLLEIPKKRMKGNSQTYLIGRVAGAVLAAGLLVVSTIFLFSETTRPFLCL